MVFGKIPDYYQQQFLGYIDTDIMPIKYNAKKIYYKEWFTFKILTKNGEPIRLECGVDGVDVEEKGYRTPNAWDIKPVHDTSVLTEKFTLTNWKSIPNLLEKENRIR